MNHLVFAGEWNWEPCRPRWLELGRLGQLWCGSGVLEMLGALWVA